MVCFSLDFLGLSGVIYKHLCVPMFFCFLRFFGGEAHSLYQLLRGVVRGTKWGFGVLMIMLQAAPWAPGCCPPSSVGSLQEEGVPYRELAGWTSRTCDRRGHAWFSLLILYCWAPECLRFYPENHLHDPVLYVFIISLGQISGNWISASKE